MTEKHSIEAFILAGGASSRMGRDKALLELGGELMVTRLASVLGALAEQITLVASPQQFVELALRVVPDDEPGLGPLGGIVTALRISRAEWNLVSACDLPFLKREWLEYLITRAQKSDAQAVLAQSPQGHLEPLCAMYRTSARPEMVAALARGVRKVTEGLAGLRLETIAMADWRAFDSRGLLFKNINSQEDYDEARRLCASEQTDKWLKGPGRSSSSK